MVTARALVERHPSTMHMTTFSPDESPRSLQLYTVDPATTYAAARMVAHEGDVYKRQGLGKTRCGFSAACLGPRPATTHHSACRPAAWICFPE